MTDRRAAAIGGLAGLVLAVLALATLCGCGQAVAAPTVERPVADSVVVVFTVSGNMGGIGSGVATDVGIITARHVVEGATLIFVRSKARVVYRADSWRPLTGGDTARLVFAKPPPIPTLPIGRLKSPKHVRCVGWWGRARDEGYLVDIHGTAWPEEPPGQTHLGYSGPWIRTSVPLHAGMSGSPLLVGRTVVGLASMRADELDYTVFAGVVR